MAVAAIMCIDAATIELPVASMESASQAWLLAAQPVTDEGRRQIGTVVVGTALDDEFAVQIRAQTRLAHTLLTGQQPLATSLAGRIATRQIANYAAFESASRATLDLKDQPCYATRFPLGKFGLQAKVALTVANVAATQRRPA